jgi:F0F1-type ATP synthase assembly protein I
VRARGGRTGLGIAAGVAAGVMLGSSFGWLLFDSAALGMSLGVAVGAVLGGALGARGERRISGDSSADPTKGVD